MNGNPNHRITNYADGFQYTGDKMDFLPTAEGYVNVTWASGSLGSPPVPTYNYVYNYTDHLGNIRLRYTKNPGGSGLRILEEDHYYPFGLKHQGYNGEHEIFEFDENISTVVLNPVNPLTGDKYKFKFQSQERQNELGLNWDSFKWRNYDYAIGRFFGVDPISEEYFSISTYQFAHNNPVWKIEIEGLEGIPTTETDLLNYEPKIISQHPGRFSIPIGDGSVGGSGDLGQPELHSINIENYKKMYMGYPGQELDEAVTAGIQWIAEKITGEDVSTSTSEKVQLAASILMVISSKGKKSLGSSSKYENVTKSSRGKESVANRKTDVTKGEFEKNLEKSGYEKTKQTDKSTTYTKDGSSYTTRPDKDGGKTADYRKNANSKDADLKIRLGEE